MSQTDVEAKVGKRFLGSTDMYVSRLGFGGNKINTSTNMDMGRLLNQVLDVGINVIDTAECYGESEELIGRSVSQRRSDYYLFTKCGHADGFNLPDWHPAVIERSIERSLKRLRTDYLDLVQLHTCSQQVFMQDEMMEVLQRVRKAGKVRYIGYSGDRDDALAAIKSQLFDTLQLTVNIADQEAIDCIIPRAVTQGMGIIAKQSLARVAWRDGGSSSDPNRRVYAKRLRTLHYDFLAYDHDEAMSTTLRFPLSIAEIDVVLIGTTSLDHFQHNMALLADGPLPMTQREAIRARWHAVTWWRRGLPGSRLGWHART
jgi:aryl-alcohol dehydrogenase-like predicted oxidoreductase